MRKIIISISICLWGHILNAQSWQYTVQDAAIFSSPKAVDLNGDQYPDIVIGTGNEDAVSVDGVLALDGRTGQKIWSYQVDNQIYSSAVFADVTNDGVPEVFIGGRKALFFCLNGATGQLVWQFDPLPFGHNTIPLRFNLYTPALVPDQNNDGYPDLVNIYGGGSTASNPSRPPGFLVLISGKTGEVLASDTMPDGRESYSSPLVHDFDEDGDPEIIFGSGEERRSGNLYRTKLSALIAGDITQAEILATDSLKGFIAVSSMADFNADGILDIASPVLNERLLVIDGQTGNEILTYTLPDFEHYATPVIGNFTGTGTPDIFCSFQKGVWPFYTEYRFVLIDGATGLPSWDSVFSYYQLTQYVALDTDDDNYDELIFCHNTDTGFSKVQYTHQAKLIDFQDDTIKNLLPVRGGLNIFSTPLLSDFDQDGLVEITYAHTLDPEDYYTVDSSRIEHQELTISDVRSIAWGGYLGNEGDGVFRRRFLVPAGLAKNPEEENFIIYPNPSTGLFFIKSNKNHNESASF